MYEAALSKVEGSFVPTQKCYSNRFMSAPNSLFVRACKSQPVDRTPIWFMRQAGRYMPEYRAVRKQYSLLEICKKPEIAADVTITAAEILGVDAAIIFADLLLPLEVMGLPFHFSTGEGPVIEKPVRSSEDVTQLRTDRVAELGYVSEVVSLVAKHFAGKLPVIGFCGAPFTLASYMIEGGGSRHYLHTKKMMYNSPADWDALMRKLVEVTTVSPDGTKHRTLVRLFNLGNATPSAEPPRSAEQLDRVEAKAAKS